jgi:hypothetical protein
MAYCSSAAQGSCAVPMEEGQMCDHCPSVPASHRVQVERDTFGAEFADLCETCYQAHVHACLNADTSGKCDWCHNHVSARSRSQDIDEGSNGPWYDVCRPCLDSYYRQLDNELSEYGPGDHFVDECCHCHGGDCSQC